MPRRRSRFHRRRGGHDSGSLLLLLVGGLALAHPRTLLLIGLLLVVGIAAFWAHRLWQQRRRRQALRQLELHEVDTMEPRQFEAFVAELLAAQGFTTHLTKASHDFGVDVVASRGGQRIAVQVKLYSRPVSGQAVGQALMGMPHYRCSECMVVTNSRFTSGAQRIAKPHPCTLVDRDGLAEWLQQARRPGA